MRYFMAVTIRKNREHDNVDEWIGMSNGLMGVFLDVIVLSGSILASNRREEEIILWFAARGWWGRGTNGFDIDEIGWDKINFVNEKMFLIRVIKEAKNKLGWKKLWYEPNTSYIFPQLDKFIIFIEEFEEKYINMEELKEFRDDFDKLPSKIPKCKEHGVLLYPWYEAKQWYCCVCYQKDEKVYDM
jgi:hypothetical protein